MTPETAKEMAEHEMFVSVLEYIKEHGLEAFMSRVEKQKEAQQ